MLDTPPFLTPIILALRNMRARWMRTALTGLGIVLGVAVILAIAIANASTLRSIRAVFDEATGQASLVVAPSTASGEGLAGGTLARVAAVEGVAAAAPAVQAVTLLAREAENWQIAVGINGQVAGNHLVLFGVDPRLDRQVRQYDLTAGRWLESDAYEAILTDKYALDRGLAVGDDLVILTPAGQERLEIVGLVQYGGAGLINDGSVAFAPLPVAQDLFARGDSLDEVAVVAAPEVAASPAALADLKERLADRLGKGYEVAYPAARGQLVSQMLATYQQGLSFFSVVALFVGAFLIYNAFSMTILERTRELGLLRALGMNRRQIFQLVLAEAAVLGGLGSALGVAFGLGLARGLIVMLGGVVATEINTISVPLDGLAQSLAVGGVVTVGSSLAPALQAARTSPLEALRVVGRSAAARPRRSSVFSGAALLFTAWAALYPLEWRPEVNFPVGSAAILLLMLGATLLVPVVAPPAERLARPLALAIFGPEGALGAGNVRRAAGRTALTVAALLVGIAMVIANSALATAFTRDISGWIETALGGDLYVRAPLPLREQFERQLAAVPGVGAITKIRYFPVRVAPADVPPGGEVDDDLIFAAIDPASYRAVADIEFAAGQGDSEAAWARFAQGDALFVSTVVADRFGVEAGDTLRLVTRRGEHEFHVAALAVDFTGQGFIVSGLWSDMRRWFGHSGVDRFTIGLAPGYTTAQVRQTIEDRYGASRNLSVETTEEFQAKIVAVSAQSFRLFDVLSVIGLVVAALGVINTLMMNVLERQREIGSLRAMGLTRWQTTKMVLAEAATLGVIGGAFGLGFGYALSQVFVNALNEMTGYDLAYVFEWGPFLAGAVVAVVVSQLAALYPAWKAAGVNIVEAVKHE